MTPVVVEGEFISEITVHDHDPHDDQFRNITHRDGLWPRFSTEPATWVSCPELPRLERALSAHFDCEILPHEIVMPMVHLARGHTEDGDNPADPERAPDERTDKQREADRNAELIRHDFEGPRL
jgi:hypothetical protein